MVEKCLLPPDGSRWVPFGVVHEHTAFPELTKLFFTNYGPVAFLGPDGGVAQIVDAALLRQLASA